MPELPTGPRQDGLDVDVSEKLQTLTLNDGNHSSTSCALPKIDPVTDRTDRSVQISDWCWSRRKKSVTTWATSNAGG